MKYIFLSYINRSGSTYLMNQISKSELICVCPEADILVDSFLHEPLKKSSFKKSFYNFILHDKKLQAWRLNKDELLSILSGKLLNIEIFFHILKLFRISHYPKSEYIAFKHNNIHQLASYLTIDSMRTVYWIKLIRNPHDIYFSQKRTISPNTHKTMGENIYKFCQKYRQFMEQSFPNKTYTIQFETLINNHNRTLDDLFMFLGLNLNTSGFTEKSGEINRFLLPSYRRIHSSIDDPPAKTRINQFRGVLSWYENYVFDQLCPFKEDRVLFEPKLSKFLFKLHWNYDRVRFYISEYVFRKSYLVLGLKNILTWNKSRNNVIKN